MDERRAQRIEDGDEQREREENRPQPRAGERVGDDEIGERGKEEPAAHADRRHRDESHRERTRGAAERIRRCERSERAGGAVRVAPDRPQGG